MKKVTFIVTILLAMAGAAQAQDTLTARTGMTKPGLGTASWGPKVNTNYDIADSSFAVQASTNVFLSSNTFTADTYFGTAGTTAVSTMTKAGVFQAGAAVQMNGFEVQGSTTTGSSAATTLVTKEYATNASNLASGTVPNARIDASSITKQGNTFNGASQLVQTTGASAFPALSGVNITALNASNLGSGTVPDARLDNSSVTLQGNTFNSGSSLLQLSGGLVPNANLDGSSVTKQGNSFNGNTQLVQTNSSGELPALSGVNLTLLNASNLASGTAAEARLPHTYVSSMTNNSPQGELVKYQISVGSFTGAGLSTCGDSSHGLAWSSANNLFSCQAITGTAAAGGSSGQIQYNSGGSLAGFPSVVTASSITISTPTIALGTPGNTIPTGYVGEIVTNAATRSLPNNTLVAIATVTLTAGNWYLYGTTFYHASVSGTQCVATIQSVAGNDFSGTTQGENRMDNACTVSPSAGDSGIVVAITVSPTTTTDYYLKQDIVFGSGTANGGGRLTAIRIP